MNSVEFFEKCDKLINALIDYISAHSVNLGSSDESYRPTSEEQSADKNATEVIDDIYENLLKTVTDNKERFMMSTILGFYMTNTDALKECIKTAQINTPGFFTLTTDNKALKELTKNLNIQDICTYINAGSRGSYIFLKTIKFYEGILYYIERDGNKEYKEFLDIMVKPGPVSQGSKPSGGRRRKTQRRRKTLGRKKTNTRHTKRRAY